MAAVDVAAAGAGTAEVEAPAAPEVHVSDEEHEEKQPAEVPKAQALQARGDLKRKRDAEDFTKKAERLEKDASLAEDGVKKKTAAVRAKAEELRRLEEELRKQQERAAVARRAALRARQEAAFHDLPPAPSRPSNPFNLFQKEMLPRITLDAIPPGKKPIHRLAELWNELPQAEKKKYTDRFDKELKEYRAWERSEEGKVFLAKRHEILKAYAQGGTQGPDAKASPAAKRARAAGEPATTPVAKAAEGPTTTPVAKAAEGPTTTLVAKAAKGPTTTPVAKAAKEPTTTPVAKAAEGPTTTPVKPRRGAAEKRPSSTAPGAVDPCIEEAVLQEANALGLHGPLLNLAGRPEVLAMKKSSQELLRALKDSDGMVNAAKRVLLASGEH